MDNHEATHYSHVIRAVVLFALTLAGASWIWGFVPKSDLEATVKALSLKEDSLRATARELDAVKLERPKLMGSYNDPKNGDWISVWRIHGYYFYDASPFLKMRMEALEEGQISRVLQKIWQVTENTYYKDLAVEFGIEVLFRESKMFTNLKHSRNSNGSIDRGGFGLNSNKKYGAITDNPYSSADVFARFEFPKACINEETGILYPREEWYSRYSDRTLWLKDMKK